MCRSLQSRVDLCLNFMEENDEVLVTGFGCKGHDADVILGVRFKIVKAVNVPSI